MPAVKVTKYARRFDRLTLKLGYGPDGKAFVASSAAEPYDWFLKSDGTESVAAQLPEDVDFNGDDVKALLGDVTATANARAIDLDAKLKATTTDRDQARAQLKTATDENDVLKPALKKALADLAAAVDVVAELRAKLGGEGEPEPAGVPAPAPADAAG